MDRSNPISSANVNVHGQAVILGAFLIGALLGAAGVGLVTSNKIRMEHARAEAATSVAQAFTARAPIDYMRQDQRISEHVRSRLIATARANKAEAEVKRLQAELRVARQSARLASTEAKLH